jgi:phosphatidylinositol alpha-1,6-mannosyltransferase
MRAQGDRVKLLALTPDFPPAQGGIQVLIDRVLRHAEQLESLVVTLVSPGASDFDSRQPYSVRRVRRVPGSRRAGFAALNLAAVRHALTFRPDAVLSGHIVTAPASWLVGRLLGIPTIQYLYADEIRAAPRLAAFALRRASAVVAISAHAEALARAAGASAEHIHLIPPGIDPVPDPSPERNGRPTVLTVARLEDEYKGHDVVLEAMKLIRERVPDVLWAVVGDGSLRPRLERLAREYGVDDHVDFLGQLDDGERDRWYRRAHVFVMPSRLPEAGGGEGFGIVYMEASAHALPVVGANVAGARDAVVDGTTGLLVDPTDPAAVAEAVTGLLQERERAMRMGRAGAEHAKRFAWPLISNRVQDLVLEQISANSTR